MRTRQTPPLVDCRLAVTPRWFSSSLFPQVPITDTTKQLATKRRYVDANQDHEPNRGRATCSANTLTLNRLQ